jgi:hypothetical protein
MAMKPTDHEIGTLYKEAGADGPSAEIDRNILAAARAAVEKQAAPTPWWTRWRLPLQAATTVCLVAMLAVMFGRHEPSPLPVPPLAMNQTGTATESRLATPAPNTADTRDRMANQAPARARAEAKTAAPAPAPFPNAPAQAPPSSQRALASAPTENPVAAESESAPPLAKAEAGAAPSAKAAARLAADQAMSPKAWLDSIQALIDQNRLAEARKRLEAFTQAYPDESIPEGIRNKLKAAPDAGNAKLR